MIRSVKYILALFLHIRHELHNQCNISGKAGYQICSKTFSKFLLRSLCYEMVVHNCCLKLLLTSAILSYYLATAPTHLRTPSNGLLCIQCQSANIAADSWDTNKELPIIWLKIWKQQGKRHKQGTCNRLFKKKPQEETNISCNIVVSSLWILQQCRVFGADSVRLTPLHNPAHTSDQSKKVGDQIQ